MRTLPFRAVALPAAVGALFALTSCVDEKIVFRDRELFEDPPSVAGDFLGYSDHDAKLTVCGNCHVDHQKRWSGSAHAGAWADLQASGGAQQFCESCHTVSQLGNAASGDVGYAASRDARYEDVQCESCHNAGLAHVTNPEATQPLAPLSVGVDATEGCGECHQGTHHPFVEEWSNSAHSTVNDFPARQPACQGCHTGEGALKAWGVNTNYLEKDEVEQPGEHLAIVCAVCHDPHGSDNEAQLRFPVDAPSVEQNLCMKCHQRRGSPDPTTFRGPHSPEGPTLLGVAGWWPPNLDFPGNAIVATHGSEANPDLCASCHVNRLTVTDPSTGDFVFQATGHLFQATPCLDEQGIPTAQTDCPDARRSFEACADSGCHGSGDVARTLMTTAEHRIDDLVNELQGLIDQIPPGEFDESDSRFTVAEGARFNKLLALSPGSVVHNPFLIEALLTASIKEVERTYGLPALSDVNLNRILGVDR